MIQFTLVGAHFRPAEAKEVLKHLVIGDTVQLHADPDNQYDDTAVAVWAEGHHIGFIPATDNSAPFAALMDGAEITAEVIAFESQLKPVLEYNLGALAGLTEDDDFGSNWGDE